MKKIIWAAAFVAAVVFWLLFSGDDSAYTDQINAEIEKRKAFLKSSPQSPFVLFGAPYEEPEYFPVDSKYRVSARVERLETKPIIYLPDNKGEKQRYQRFAWLHFRLEGEAHKLMVLKPAAGFGGGDFFFLAFSDETSGEASYGGGRYLDLQIGQSDKVVLDFNLAYSPYCAYADEYSCPLPLRENRLELPIEAGEKYVHDYESRRIK